jgi:hypothetical protein
VQLKDILKENRRGKYTKGVFFFHSNDIWRDFNVKQFSLEQPRILPKNVIVGIDKKNFFPI